MKGEGGAISIFILIVGIKKSLLKVVVRLARREMDKLNDEFLFASRNDSRKVIADSVMY